MWHRMFTEQIPFDEKVLRTVLVYAVVSVLIRLTGKAPDAALTDERVVIRGDCPDLKAGIFLAQVFKVMDEVVNQPEVRIV